MRLTVFDDRHRRCVDNSVVDERFADSATLPLGISTEITYDDSGDMTGRCRRDRAMSRKAPMLYS